MVNIVLIMSKITVWQADCINKLCLVSKYCKLKKTKQNENIHLLFSPHTLNRCFMKLYVSTTWPQAQLGSFTKTLRLDSSLYHLVLLLWSVFSYRIFNMIQLNETVWLNGGLIWLKTFFLNTPHISLFFLTYSQPITTNPFIK